MQSCLLADDKTANALAEKPILQLKELNKHSLDLLIGPASLLSPRAAKLFGVVCVVGLVGGAFYVGGQDSGRIIENTVHTRQRELPRIAHGTKGTGDVPLASVGALTYDYPIVGILTQPLSASIDVALDASLGSTAGSHSGGRTYLDASYVKFAESAGARVVPVHFDASDADLRSLFGQINGLIFPGGCVGGNTIDDKQFRRAASLLFRLALDATDQGSPFPIHGTCLGFQLLTVIAAQDDSVLSRGSFQADDAPSPLNFTTSAKSSRLLAAMPPSLLSALESENITAETHEDGFTPEAYETNPRLREFFVVLSTNTDQGGRTYTSTVEARNYPITGTQWHPEKSNFAAIGPQETLSHSANAVAVSQYMANNFVGRARLSSHRFKSVGAMAKMLISNYAPVRDPEGSYSQMYIWDQARVTFA